MDVDLQVLVAESGMTKQEIADKAGVSRAALFNWLAGRSLPADAQAEKLAGLFGCPPSVINPLYKFCKSGKHFDPPREKRGAFMVCALCAQAGQTKYAPRRAERSREARQERKARVIVKYGGQCSCCGESEIGFLTIDHKNDDGHTERSSEFYTKLDRSPVREDLHVMCFNCNCGRAANGGVCPHNREVGGWPFAPGEDH